MYMHTHELITKGFGAQAVGSQHIARVLSPCPLDDLPGIDRVLPLLWLFCAYVPMFWNLFFPMHLTSCSRHQLCRLLLSADVQMLWHPQGTYLAVQVDRFTKTKKSIYTSFELFSLKVPSRESRTLATPPVTRVMEHACNA